MSEISPRTFSYIILFHTAILSLFVLIEIQQLRSAKLRIIQKVETDFVTNP